MTSTRLASSGFSENEGLSGCSFSRVGENETWSRSLIFKDFPFQNDHFDHAVIALHSSYATYSTADLKEDVKIGLKYDTDVCSHR